MVDVSKIEERSCLSAQSDDSMTAVHRDDLRMFGTDSVVRQRRLASLADAAIRDFGTLCFWSVPEARSLDPLMKAKLAARLIQKHGGARGLRAAAEIEAELHAAGETPWR